MNLGGLVAVICAIVYVVGILVLLTKGITKGL